MIGVCFSFLTGSDSRPRSPAGVSFLCFTAFFLGYLGLSLAHAQEPSPSENHPQTRLECQSDLVPAPNLTLDVQSKEVQPLEVLSETVTFEDLNDEQRALEIFGKIYRSELIWDQEELVRVRRYFDRKRKFDLAFVVLSSPVWGGMSLLGVVAIKVEGMLFPIYARKPIVELERAGMLGLPFRMLKLQTMMDREVAERNGIDWAPNTAENDPRVTPVGRVLRKLKIDEFFNFVNVWRGEMSVVGPRAKDRKREGEAVLAEDQRYLLRYLRPAGVTSPQQIKVRKLLDGGDAARDPNEHLLILEYEIQDLQKLSLWEDVKTIAGTVQLMAARLMNKLNPVRIAQKVSSKLKKKRQARLAEQATVAGSPEDIIEPNTEPAN